MPQRFVALRMAEARGLRGDYPRVRFASADAPPTAGPALRHARSGLQVSARRPPVRSASDVGGLRAAAGALAAAWGPWDAQGPAVGDAEAEDASADELRPPQGHEEADDGVEVPKELMFALSALLVLCTSGGLILGFGPVYSTLVRERQWSELCGQDDVVESEHRPGEVICAAQEIRLQYVFSTSFLCLSAANAMFGVTLDVFGPRVTVLVGLVLSALGNSALAMGDSKDGTGSLIIAGYALIGAGGMGSYLAAFQILQLYSVQGFVCSVLSSLFNCSGYIYMLLQFDGLTTRKDFFASYGIIVLACTCVCFLLFPTNNVVAPSDFLVIPGFKLEKPHIHPPHGLLDALKIQLMNRRDLWFFAVFFGWISLLFAFAGGALPSLLNRLAGDNVQEARLFTDVLYPVLVNGTFLYSPVIGYAIDHFGFKLVFVACLGLTQIFAMMMLVPSLAAQALTFIVYAMAQACLYALQFAYIMMCFPPELYGTLQAFLAVVSFTFGLLNYVINPWTQTSLDGDYTAPIALLGLPTLLLYALVSSVHNGHDDHTVMAFESNENVDKGKPNEYTRLVQI